VDDAELLVLILAAVMTAVAAFQWYWPLVVVWPRGRAAMGKIVLALLPLVAFFFLYYVLRTWASHDVVDSPPYIAFYLLLGFAWLAVGVFAMRVFFDLLRVDDILLLGNRAALSAFVGGFLGLTAIYAGGNVGDGPGFWCVVWAAGLGTVALITLGLVVNATAGVFERITVERDAGAGFRFGCWLLATGIVLGRAVAGDWFSPFGAVIDLFADGWPALPLALFAVMIERFMRPAPDENVAAGPSPGSILLGALYIGIALAAVLLLIGPPAANPAYSPSAMNGAEQTAEPP